MNTYQKRWTVAVCEAARINKWIKDGYVAIDWDQGEANIFETPFIITESEIRQEYLNSSGNKTIILWFRNDPTFDEGLHTPIAKIRQRFANIKFYAEVRD